MMMLVIVLQVLAIGIMGLYSMLEIAAPTIDRIHEYNNLHTIDTSKYKITESGNVIK